MTILWRARNFISGWQMKKPRLRELTWGKILWLVIDKVRSRLPVLARCCLSILIPRSGWRQRMALAQPIEWMSNAESVSVSFSGHVVQSPMSIPSLLAPLLYCFLQHAIISENWGCHPLRKDAPNRNLDPFIFGKSFSRERELSLKTCSFPVLGRKSHSPGEALSCRDFTAVPGVTITRYCRVLLGGTHGWGLRPVGLWHRKLPPL